MPPEDATSPVAEDTSATGVAADTQAATDEITDDEFDALNTMPAPDEDAEAGGAADGKADAEDGEERVAAAADDGTVEVEAADGTKVKVPAALKDDFLRHADYTRKTQEHAEAKRAFETERQTFQQQREDSLAALPEEYARVAVLKTNIATAQSEIAEFEKIDWATWRATTSGLPGDDPARQQYQQYRAAYDAARETEADIRRDLGKATEDLSTKEQTRLEEQRTAQEGAVAKARQETADALKSAGWDQPRFAKVATFAVQEFGVSPEELATVTDPRTWKMADEVMTLRERNAKLEAALKQNKTADANLKAQAAKPTEPAKGNAQPTRVRDDIGTGTWMERRNRDVAAKRAAAAKR